MRGLWFRRLEPSANQIISAPMGRLCYRIEVLTPPPPRRAKAERLNPTNADRWPGSKEDEGSKKRAEMWEWCRQFSRDFYVEIRQSKSKPWSCTYCFASMAVADAFRKHFGAEEMTDLDSVRVKRLIQTLQNSETEPDEATLMAARRLKERAPSHPLITQLTRLMNQRSGF